MASSAPGTPAVSPLGEALQRLRMSGTFYCRSEFTAPWGLALPPLAGTLSFHVVVAGGCWIEVEGAERCRLDAGDLALVPHGRGHLLRSDSRAFPARLFDLPRELVSERYEILRHGGGGEPARILCGAVRFDDPAARQLVGLLPPLVVLDAASESGEWIRETIRFVEAEARALRPGGETVITRLADVLVIQAIRAWVEEDPAAQRGWLGALRDPQIGLALALVHRDPGREWTLASLAREVAMSRSAFAARFAERVGEPVMRYVTRWRMQLAAAWLLDEPAVGLAEIATRVGYESEAAFSRAFRRVTGTPPGAVRRAARGGHRPPDPDGPSV